MRKLDGATAFHHHNRNTRARVCCTRSIVLIRHNSKRAARLSSAWRVIHLDVQRCGLYLESSTLYADVDSEPDAFNDEPVSPLEELVGR